jgi:hypothetical protein
MRRDGVTAVEVKSTWADVYQAWLQGIVSQTAWATASNYYKVASGKVVTQWPSGAGVYALLVRALGRMAHKGRRHDPEQRASSAPTPPAEVVS